MQFQNISLAHSDLLKWLFWTNRHALLFHHINTLGASQQVCRRLIIHFQKIRSDLDLNMLLHRIPNNFCKLTFAFPASKLWDMPWLLGSFFFIIFFVLDQLQKTNASLSFPEIPLCMTLVFCFLTMLWPDLLNAAICFLAFCLVYVPIPLSYAYHTCLWQLWCLLCKNYKTC